MNRSEVCSRFLDSLAVEPYPFQEEALLAWFETDDGLLVTAPTGMGKTLIAEAAVFEALHTRTRAYYTTPLIALTDQKFRELQSRAVEWGFDATDVGLITGNRRENPDATIRVVVAEILLNHLLSEEDLLRGTSSVIMDEFHNFNDQERGVVWELSVTLLPKGIRLMLLSATVGNPVEFLRWLREKHGRDLRIVRSTERRVPLEFIWVGDRFLTEQLPLMHAGEQGEARTPALVFCFNRDECWEVAERLKGVDLIDNSIRQLIENELPAEDFRDGIGPKLRQMLIRGVGVHHAGVLPKHKEMVERLFLRKHIPFVVCTETLAAGINLPARSVVLNTLLKGKPGDRKVVSPSVAHQMFGRAGRPQFDSKGFVYAFAHEDDVRIVKWKKRYDQIDPKSKDPGLLRVKKDMERKKPSRRRTEQYWTEGQFQTLTKAGPADLASRSMIPYQVLLFLLTRKGALHDVRSFLSNRFTNVERIELYQRQLNQMLANLQTFGFLTIAPDSDHVTLHESIHQLTVFRSVDPLYGAFAATKLAYANYEEKILALESFLEVPWAIFVHVQLPEDLPMGPLEEQVLRPELIQRGVISAEGMPVGAMLGSDDSDDFDDRFRQRPLTFPEMLKAAFDIELASPEKVTVQPKRIAGEVFELECDFFKYVRSHNLAKNEGLILRHLLRLVILCGEFFTRTQDPDYQRIGELCTRACRQVDPRYTDRFLADAIREAEAEKLPV